MIRVRWLGLELQLGNGSIDRLRIGLGLGFRMLGVERVFGV
jgi:hypothetical protein